VRPNFITLEKGGVNANSSMPGDSDYYRNLPSTEEIPDEDGTVKHAFGKWALSAIAYYVTMRLLCWHYPHYRHHRNDSVLLETFYGVRNGWRKIVHGFAERGVEASLETDLHRRYFFVVLQTLGDFQISTHSPFIDNKDFIGVVLRSFAAHGPDDARLIIKHHPLDRGRIDYSGFIRRLANSNGIADRVLTVHDVHLPTCLINASGTITVNSTVGISSLFHGTPTIALGKALYDMDGLTCKGMLLDRFWTEYTAPDRTLFEKFRASLIDHTQLTGSFYSGFSEMLRGPLCD
jgi:capsular polysaccharide export protein